MGAALQVWTDTFCKAFDGLSPTVQDAVHAKIHMVGYRLESFPHVRLKGSPGFRPRVGDCRVLYDFDVSAGRVYLLHVGLRREVCK